MVLERACNSIFGLQYGICVTNISKRKKKIDKNFELFITQTKLLFSVSGFTGFFGLLNCSCCPHFVQNLASSFSDPQSGQIIKNKLLNQILLTKNPFKKPLKTKLTYLYCSSCKS